MLNLFFFSLFLSVVKSLILWLIAWHKQQFCWCPLMYLQSTGRAPIKILTKKTENFCKVSTGPKWKLPRRQQVCECYLSGIKVLKWPSCLGGPINVMKGLTDNEKKAFGTVC